MQWEKMVADYPEILAMSTNKYQNWETTDPERWVPHGYAVVRVDSRGAGWSPGFMDPATPREIEDLYQCIEWAGTQPWSNGKVGMLGISYYSSNQWRVAGTASAASRGDHPVGRAERPLPRLRLPRRHPVRVPEALGQAPGGEHPVRPGRAREEESEHRRIGRGAGHALRRGDGEEPRGRVRGAEEAPVRRRVAPLAHGGSLARARRRSSPARTGAGRAYIRAATSTATPRRPTTRRSGSKPTATRTGRSSRATTASTLQKRFFDYFLKGEQNGWDKQPRVQLNIRHPGRALRAAPRERVAARAHAVDEVLSRSERQGAEREAGRAGEHAVEYEALGNGVTFRTPPLERETEITGPMMARLYVSSSTADTDLFVIVRVFDPAGKELTFMGSTDPNTPIANGWLRASHRRLDPKKSKPWRPYHPHDRVEPLTPGEIYECDVEIVTSSHRGAGRLARRADGARQGLRVRRRALRVREEVPLRDARHGRHDAQRSGQPPGGRSSAGRVTLHAGGGRESYLLLPIIPLVSRTAGFAGAAWPATAVRFAT